MICPDTHCPRCNPETLVKLLQCEAKTLLSWPLRIRQAFLVEATKKRGAEAVGRLKAEMKRPFEARADLHAAVQSFTIMAGEVVA